MSRELVSRRRFLAAIGATGATGFAGCSIIESTRATLYVAPDGSDDNPGTEDEPLATIRRAVNSVEPGGTVHVLPGTYHQSIGITEDSPGEAGDPITLTGPPEAIVKPPEEASNAIGVTGSHFRLTGLTIDGLLDEANPEDPESYSEPSLIGITPKDPDPKDPHYVEDLVLSPHRLGNCQSALINAALLKDSEIGGFEVVGPAGAEWIFGDTDGHNGEIVYLGTAPGNLERNQGIEVYDETRNIHVHHIDNSEGHPHSELVDCKIGTRNITVEYCTDGGGAQTEDSYYQPAIALDGRDCTVRRNVIQNVEGSGVRIGPNNLLSNVDSEGKPETEYAIDALPETKFEKRMGKDHAIYDNVFTGYTQDAINLLRESKRPGRASNPQPDDQRVLCGNLYDAYSDADPGTPCSTDTFDGDGVGHLGGDSPRDGDIPTKDEVIEQHANARHLDVTVDEDTIPVRTPFEIPITVENTGDTTREVVFRLRAGPHVLSSETSSVPPKGKRRVTLSENVPHPGELAVTRNGQKIHSVQVTDDT